MDAEVTRRGALDMQVCVPDAWTDDQVKTFADAENPCGTKNGWFIRRAVGKESADYPERNPCASRAGCVHIVLHAYPVVTHDH